MKKTVVALLTLCVLGCYLWYHQGERAAKAEELIWAAYDGDLTGVKNALEDGAEPDWALYVSDPQRHYHNAEFSSLLAAASGGNVKVLLHLIKQGQNVNASNEQGWTPLFIAVRDGHAEAAAQLVHAGADPNIQTDTGGTPLILAFVSDFSSEKQRLSLIEYLLKRGANPNLQTNFGTDALFYAVTELKDPKAAALLAAHGADLCRQYGGKDILQIASQNKTSAKLIPALQKARAEKCSKHN